MHGSIGVGTCGVGPGSGLVPTLISLTTERLQGVGGDKAEPNLY